MRPAMGAFRVAQLVPAEEAGGSLGPIRALLSSGASWMQPNRGRNPVE